MLKAINKVEDYIYYILCALLLVVIIAALIDLIIFVFLSVVPEFTLVSFLTSSEMLRVLESFLLILIAIELLETVKIFIRDHVLRVEGVIILALIAIARKVIVLDTTLPVAHFEMIGIAAIIFALGAAYYFVKKADTWKLPGTEK